MYMAEMFYMQYNVVNVRFQIHDECKSNKYKTQLKFIPNFVVRLTHSGDAVMIKKKLKK